MSEGQRIAFGQAIYLSGPVMAMLQPFCDRIEFAGSIRRKKPEVGDVEIVCVPKAEHNLLGEAYRSDLRIETAIYAAGYNVIKNGKKFKQFDLGPCKVDLFITTPECWGVIFTIRTGCAEFSHRLVTPKSSGGLMPSILRFKDGQIWCGSEPEPLETPEELDVFNALGLDWIAPEDRIA